MLLHPKADLDLKGLREHLRRLPKVSMPGFEVWIREGWWREWTIEGATRIRVRGVGGIIVKVEGFKGIVGEVIVADRPLGEDERGLLILVGAHPVLRSTFKLLG